MSEVAMATSRMLVGVRMCGRRRTAQTAQLVTSVIAISAGEMNPFTGTTNGLYGAMYGSGRDSLWVEAITISPPAVAVSVMFTPPPSNCITRTIRIKFRRRDFERLPIIQETSSKQAQMYYESGTVHRIASRADAACALTRRQHSSVWNDVMCAILKVYDVISEIRLPRKCVLTSSKIWPKLIPIRFETTEP